MAGPFFLSSRAVTEERYHRRQILPEWSSPMDEASIGSWGFP